MEYSSFGLAILQGDTWVAAQLMGLLDQLPSWPWGTNPYHPRLATLHLHWVSEILRIFMFRCGRSSCFVLGQLGVTYFILRCGRSFFLVSLLDVPQFDLSGFDEVQCGIWQVYSNHNLHALRAWFEKLESGVVINKLGG